MQPRLTAVFHSIARLLAFRLTREEFLRFGPDHLMVGIFCTWIVGMGRTLHNTRVEWWQHLGLGSVAYIFVLSLLLWLFLLPLRVANLSYRHVLTFVSLTSPTGIIYAIPVESFMDFDWASTSRLWFLAIVATWRVALWCFYLARFCRLGGGGIFALCTLPLCLIVAALTMLNLDRVVFNFMGGGPVSTDHPAFFALLFITMLAVYAFIPLLCLYIGVVLQKRISERSNKPSTSGNSPTSTKSSRSSP